MLRLKVADLDLAGKMATIHEKKRVRGKTTTRCVRLSSFLVGVLQDWLAEHPGGPYLFAQAAIVPRSKTRSATTGHQGSKTRAKTQAGRSATVRARSAVPTSPLTPQEAHDHFRRTLAQSRWSVLRGWHVLRHSYCSALAAKGVDQRIIDDIMGHQTEDMRRRYRHLLPSLKQDAVASVFG
jgi:integrase